MTPVSLYGSSLSPAAQRRAFEGGDVPVAVYGLGKMGLPLAMVYAETTGNVVGVDVDQGVVDTLNAGECHVTGEPGLPEAVAEQVTRGAFRATVDASDAAATVHVVIVPTLVTDDHRTDLSILESACRALGANVTAGDLVVVECTVPPGTARDLVRPLVAEVSGLDEAAFGVAVCPERTLSGRALSDVRGGHPKIVGGVDAESTRVARLVYESLTTNDVIPVADATTAECVKLFEGLYRDVNIALANELATLTDELGIDVVETIDAANSQPFCDIHTPGPGVGGHCIPYYPYFVMDRVERDTPLLRTARQVNDSMPRFTAEKVEDELAAVGKHVADATVLVLGLTYRPGVAEIRATPAKPLVERLAELGARVLVCDPVLDDTSDFAGERVDVDDLLTTDPDAVVVVTPHAEFDAIDWDAFEDVVVVDGRGSVGETRHPVYRIGGGRRVGSVERTAATDGGDANTVAGGDR
ncbi:UDP-N-acetyl-D-mannosaminuronic acid dehydrogenase [Halogranum gelatinilyticum]|uniref:UDP-N-acetyl-D-mannosamine dehydrogenase n=1 Tax=Halogranum gelatinilyticum TaxID=660521 RepID=A0A1G9USE3_9EURY|nr:nucleotide sugar dehydrogenase [Halogranum gelatinilyticum]SDM62804.1 UDP-N-acetyl-D-mannosaminuronic acid dehydrogenase [Halogranum gelatinilyticum]